MNPKSAVLLGALLSFTLVTSGCPGTGESELDLAIDTAKASLGAEYDADLVTFDSLGFTAAKMEQTTPDYGIDTVALYGEAAAITFGREKLKATTKTQGDYLRTIVQNGVVDGIEDFARSLVVLGQTDQTDPLLNQPLIRYSYIDLGYRVENILCLSNIHKQLDAGEPLFRTRCDLAMDLGSISESYALQALLFSNLKAELKQEAAALGTYLAAIDDVRKQLGTAAGTPDFLNELNAKVQVVKDLLKTRQTQQASFGERVNSGLNVAGGAIASGASLIAPATEPGADHSSAVQNLQTLLDQLAAAQVDIDAGMDGTGAVGALPQDALAGLDGAVKTAGDAITAAAGGDTQSALMQATQAMQTAQMSFDQRYLQLQKSMQNENRQYTTVSNVLKTKHDTVKNSIGNIR